MYRASVLRHGHGDDSATDFRHIHSLRLASKREPRTSNTTVASRPTNPSGDPAQARTPRHGRPRPTCSRLRTGRNERLSGRRTVITTYNRTSSQLPCRECARVRLDALDNACWSLRTWSVVYELPSSPTAEPATFPLQSKIYKPPICGVTRRRSSPARESNVPRRHVAGGQFFKPDGAPAAKAQPRSSRSR